jgi:Leucine-rich repeat (LRR) protein
MHYQKLLELNLSNNHLRNLPDAISFLANLYSLNLDGNQLIDLPPEITSRYERWKFNRSPHPAFQQLQP